MERSKLANRRYRRRLRKREAIRTWAMGIALAFTLTFSVCSWIYEACIMDMQTELLQQTLEQRIQIEQLHNEIVDNKKAASENQSETAVGMYSLKKPLTV